MTEIAEIAERMYEAAFLPELWMPLLDDLAMITGSGEGGIGLYWPEQRGITTSRRISTIRVPWEQSRTETDNWLKHVRSGLYLNQGFFQLDPFRGDWAEITDFEQRLISHKANGLGVQTGTIVELFNGEIITLEFTRHIGQPRYEDAVLAELNGLNNAFRQSVLFASRLQFERAKNSVDTLNQFGLPAALVNSSGQVLHANNVFEGADEYFRKLPTGEIRLRGSDDQRRIFALGLERSHKEAVTIPIHADNGRSAAVINFMPMCRCAQSIFSMNCSIMMFNPVSATIGVPSAAIIGNLFGLTPTEAKLARTLSSGLSLRDSAANQDISIGTARSYLNRIFSKTRTAQQSELVSLVKSAVTPG